jgi:predicted permease
MKESDREQRGLPFIETFFQDARYGARTLLRNPGFTLAALVTLTLGIGANSAIFSVVNAVLLKPIPYPDPARIVQMFRNNRGLQTGFDARRFQFFQEHARSFEALAAWRSTAFNMVAGDTAEHLPAVAVSKDYFRVFGGTPIHGRTFEPLEDLPNGPDVVILTHGLWQRSFGSDPSVVGTTVSLGERPYRVVGVMPRGFDSLQKAELYVPLKPSPSGPGGGFNYRVGGRLREGVTRAQANAESALTFDAYTASLPPSVTLANEGPPRFLLYQDSLSRPVRPALFMMLGAVGMLLLIACANTANLLLARATGRGREISVRTALGAGRGRIVRQLVTESMLLFVAGGLMGVILAYLALPTLVAMTPAGYLPAQTVAVDGSVLAATVCLSLITGLVFGLTPALSLSRHDLADAFKADGTRTTSTRRTNGLRRGLVVAEVALCMLLLTGAGLLIQTFISLRAVDVGFDPRNVLTARMSLMGERFSSSEAVNRLYQQGLERLRRVPGIESAAVVSGIPIEPGLNLNFDRLETSEREAHLTDWRYVSADYFTTLGVEIVRGRGLRSTDDRAAPRVAVVSQQFAHQYYQDADPIGRQIQIFSADGPIEIVGVAEDLREAGLRGGVPAVMYVPVAQAGDAAVRTSHFYFQVSWVVRAASLSAELRQRIRAELRAIDPRQPITSFRSMDEVKARAMQAETFQMMLLATLAGIGLVLAAAGIYGLLAYSVAQRTREFGIRLALGASRPGIVASVVRQGALLTAAGIVVGMLAGALLTRTIQSFIAGVTTPDPRTLAVVAGVLFLVAVLASLVPALRAVRLNPVSALREI